MNRGLTLNGEGTHNVGLGGSSTSAPSTFKPAAIVCPHQELVRHIVNHGKVRTDRTGVGTRSVFGYQMRFDLAQGFPLITTKRTRIKPIIHELLWFLRGETNITPLNEAGVHIWDQWADEQGELGPVYGKQWRSWEGADGQEIDQIHSVVKRLKTNPDCRRLVVSAWNVADLPRMALAPCHCLFQFYVSEGRLSCQLYQRSADVFLGVPFNIASYALLTMMIANVVGLKYGEFIHTFGDAHLYLNHEEQVRELLTRDPQPWPTMKVSKYVRDIFDFGIDDFLLHDYDPHKGIKAPIAV